MTTAWAQIVKHTRLNGRPHPKHDLDLGDEHWLDWSYYEGKLTGGVIWHLGTYPGARAPLCAGSFSLQGSPFASPGHTWTLTGDLKVPTLAPSFRCHCGDHGFIHSGRWVRA